MKDVAVEKAHGLGWADPEAPSVSRYGAGPLKRIFDLVICVALAPVVLPVIGLFWAGIALRDGAPIFRHTRIGKDGKPFRCMKFRSMVRNADEVLKAHLAEHPEAVAEWRKYRKLTNDPRITKLGRILRKTSLDELPQYFNVLRGEMSFVGPRPITAEECEQYRALGGWAYTRLRPGITGPWQVSVRHEAPFDVRLGYDERYLADMSMLGDLSLMAKTVTVVFQNKGA